MNKENKKRIIDLIKQIKLQIDFNKLSIKNYKKE